MSDQHSPLPWRVVLSEYAHRKGSPICEETCGRGEVPIRTEYMAPSASWPDPEGHVMKSTIVEDVVAADESHVICTGHDYNDGGHVEFADANFIVRACNSYDELLAALKGLVERALEECDTTGCCGCTDRSQEIVAARAAIAKAEGR